MCDGNFILGQLVQAVDHVLVRRIVDQNVDPTKFGERFINDFLAVLLLAKVRGIEIAFSAVLLHKFLGVLGILLLLGEVGDQSVGPFHGVKSRDGTTDATIASSDDGFLPFEFARCLVRLVSAIFGWHVLVCGCRAFHVLLEARLGLMLNGYLMAYSKSTMLVRMAIGKTLTLFKL